jgi:undecaprenyl pyrophosphate phosphatase UppP
MSERAKFPAWTIFLNALALTGLMGFITRAIEKNYLSTHSYFYDCVSYSFYNARLFTRIADEGRFHLAAQEWLINPRHPLRTIAALVLAPETLAKQLGHMATALPMFFIFLLLLGWTVYKRTAHLAYALACMILFCAVPVFFDPLMGLAAFWLDLPASFLVGAAALCLLNADEGRKWKWVVGFAVLVSLAALSRYVAAVYAFVACAPVLVDALLRRWRRDGDVVRSVLQPVLLIAVVIGILAGYFLIAQLRFNTGFYTTYAYGVGHGVLDSLRDVSASLLQFITLPGAIALAVICLVNLVIFARGERQDWHALIVSLWLASSVILLLVFGIREVGATHVTLYVVPLVYLAVVSPAPLDVDSRVRRWLTPLACAFAVVAVCAVWNEARGNFQKATHPSSAAQAQKNFDVALAQALDKEGERIVWMTYFQEYAWIPAMETFYRYHKLPLPAGGGFYEDHEELWVGHYPKLSPEQVSERVYAATVQWVDVAVVFDDTQRIETSDWINNAYSRTVAKAVAERIRADASWQRAFVVESERYGAVVGYRNLTTHGRGYDMALRNLAQINP